jgi:hypothetical protein
MKVAHLNYCPTDGVFKKISGQAKAAKELGLDLDFLVLSESALQKGWNIKSYSLNLPRNRILKKIARDFFRYKTMGKSVNLAPYHRVILRYPSSVDLRYKNFFDKHKNKIITEHHSNVIMELRNLEVGPLNPFRLFLERLNAPKLLSRVAGIIAVTDEIRNMQLNLLAESKPSTVISNGVDVESIPFTEFRGFNGQSLSMVFVSNTFYSWHGLDRLLEGMRDYQGDIRLNLFLMGRVYRKKELKMIEDLKKKSVNIHLLEKCTGEKMNDYFKRSNIAIGSLALYRNRMSQACVLKTREYMARGIPFIYAYEDVDFGDDCDFALKFANSRDPIDMDKVIRFAQQVSKKEALSLTMRTYASKHLDWKNKIRKMYEFAVKV